MYAHVDTNPLSGRIAATARNLAFFALAGLLGASASSGAEDGYRPSEAWYRIEVSGEPAGWAMEKEELRGGEIVTESKMHLELRRGSAVAEMEMESRFVETRDGRPVAARTLQKLGAFPVESTYEFREDGVRVRHRQSSGEVRASVERREEILPLPEGQWWTPGQVRRRVRQEIERGATRISIRSLDLLLGFVPVTTDWTLEERGRDTSRWKQRQSYAPQVTTLVEVDADGLTVRSETTLLGLQMTMTLAEREEVLGTAVSAETAPEVLVRSFLRPERRIARPRELRRAVYELSSGAQALPELPSAGAQTAEVLGETLRVTVDLDTRTVVGRASGGATAESEREKLTASTPWLEHDDPLIRELAARALAAHLGSREDPSDEERAEALRAFVADYLVDKDLDTVLATATEVALRRSGDCTEHSVLLAALLRAVEIPSRVVSGLVYVERFAGEAEIFGYHMWTQALVDGRFLDLDATLSGQPFDAAHIALAASALDGGLSVIQETARVLPAMDGLRIRVLELAYRPSPRGE